MTKEEMNDKVRGIIEADAGYGFQMFACLKDEDGLVCAPFILEDKDNNSFKDYIGKTICNCINERFLSDNIDLKQSDDINDNTKSLFEIIQDDNYKPFDFVLHPREESYSDEEKSLLFGFIFKYCLNNEYFFAYQQLYPVTVPKRKKGTFVYSKNHIYKEFNKELLRIDYRVDILIIDNSIITEKINLLQSKFRFASFIKRESRIALELIRELDIVEDLTKIVEFEDDDKLINAKKLMKIKNSPVLRMRRKDLIRRLKEKPRYSNKVKIKNGKIQIKKTKEVKELLKILNDDYLKSELTEEDYESSNKKIDNK